MAGAKPLVEVALPLPVHHTFTYSVDGGRATPPGTRVLVPFRQGERIGWIVGPGRPDSEARRIRPVLSILDDEPTATPELLELVRWMADYYVAPVGVTLRSAMPSVLADASRDFISLTGVGAPRLTPRQVRIIAALRANGRPQRVQALRRTLRMGSVWQEIRRLEALGVVHHRTLPPAEPTIRTRRVARIVRWLESLDERDEIFARARRQRASYEVLEAAGGSLPLASLLDQGFSRAVVKGLVGKQVVEMLDEEVVRDPFSSVPVPDPPKLTPTSDQAAALEALLSELDTPTPRPFLLHGVTASGKTLVYIELLREVVDRRGGSAIVLVPEISLTPQTVARFRAHFGDRVAVLHSALSDGERYDAWRQLRQGRKRIAVGARSAIFAPLSNLGAIVVDEEHDGSYKQSEAPRYHAKDVAVMRAHLAGAVCVLGSATPSLESWSNQDRGKFELLRLPTRAMGVPLPPVRVVDLREIRASGSGNGGRDERGGDRSQSWPRPRGENTVILSSVLDGAIRDRLEREEQTILLLNRRGYSSFVQCRECGEVQTCVSCSVSLTYHRVSGRLLCHHCRHEEPAPDRCPRCGGKNLALRGLGTEQVERSVAESFPTARIARMDIDTTSRKWAHSEILGRVGRGEVDILLGTQMIAKGLDFPRVTLVGVVDADVGIHLPDFRATERTFQLLSQVAGRAGRGPLGGEVMIQTRVPEHYAIQAARAHDYEGFARRELAERAGPPYPPHVRMVNVVVSSPDPDAAVAAAEGATAWIRARLRGRIGSVGARHSVAAARDRVSESRTSDVGVEVTGPAPSPIERLHGRWRWHFLLRAASVRALGTITRDFALGFRPTGSADVRVSIDRDPVALL